jgi:hypothetical protein
MPVNNLAFSLEAQAVECLTCPLGIRNPRSVGTEYRVTIICNHRAPLWGGRHGGNQGRWWLLLKAGLYSLLVHGFRGLGKPVLVLPNPMEAWEHPTHIVE